jgi:AraC-like DNA-binding protein
MNSALTAARAGMSLRSTDLEEARAHLSRMFKPHQLNVTGSALAFDARIDHLKAQGCSINQVSYGAGMMIDPDRLQDFYLVLLPKHGRALVDCGNRSFEVTPAVSAVLPPDEAVRMRWDAECAMQVLRIDRTCLERTAQGLDAGEHISLSRTLEPRLLLGQDSGRTLARLVADFRAALLDSNHLIHQPAMARQMEATLCTALLLAQQPRQGIPMHDPSPSSLRRARDFIHAHVADPITVQELAAYARVSVRSLFAAFRVTHAVSPMEYQRELRLQAVRAELLARGNDPGASVTDIATRWGFSHLSRFAAIYHERFGEHPSAALRAAKHHKNLLH